MMKTQKTHILSQQDESIKVLAAQQSRDLSATASLKEAREIMLTIRSHKEFIRVTEGDEFEFDNKYNNFTNSLFTYIFSLR